MFNVGGFFQKFLTLQSKEIGIRNFIVESLKKNVGLTVEVNDIDIKDGVVYIKKLSQAGKNALFMKKDVVVDEVNSLQSARKINTIRY